MTNIVGFLGNAAAGKDTAAKALLQIGFTRVAFADPLKEIAQQVYAFSFDQLWGPSWARNLPDPRYPRTERAEAWLGRVTEEIDITLGALHPTWIRAIRNEFGDEAATHFLTPRETCQRLGVEWGRHCYGNTWVDLGVRRARECQAAVIPDVRFLNEVRAIRRAGGAVFRITRPGCGLAGALGAHSSEMGQSGIADEELDGVIANDGTIDQLHAKVVALVRARAA